MVTNAIVNSDGSVLWLYLALVKTYCKLNVKYFPFDTQRCNVTFVSWTHSMNQLDVIYNHTTFPVASYYNDDNQVSLHHPHSHALANNNVLQGS